MLGSRKTLILDQLVQVISLPLTRLSFEDSVAPLVLFQPMPQLWISHSRLIGHDAQLEPFTTIWTGPQAEQGTSLCLLQERF